MQVASWPKHHMVKSETGLNPVPQRPTKVACSTQALGSYPISVLLLKKLMSHAGHSCNQTSNAA